MLELVFSDLALRRNFLVNTDAATALLRYAENYIGGGFRADDGNVGIRIVTAQGAAVEDPAKQTMLIVGIGMAGGAARHWRRSIKVAVATG